MLKWLFLLWLCLEITVFVWIGKWIGAGWTVLLVLLGFFIGVGFLRREGLGELNRLSQKIRAREPLTDQEVLSGPFILLGGILLMIPGFISDVLGLLLFFPLARKGLAKWLAKKVKRAQPKKASTDSTLHHGRTFEGEFHEHD